MSEIKSDMNELESDLDEITKKGIQADRKRIKEDMCAQFADPREWIREYAVNSFDAGARRCWISGYEDKDTITIVVEDDGHGMDRQGVQDYHMIYRSVKHGNKGEAIGRYGIGKLSVAAVPGQIKFSMLTSTGKECWRMAAGCLIDDTPIKLEKIEPVPGHGTRFEVTFRKRVSLRRELKELAAVLEKYVCYLPITIVVFEKTGDEVDAREHPHVIQGSWTAHSERLSRNYQFKLHGNNYDVMIGLGDGKHKIYQNHVLVSDKYNLLSHDMFNDLELPYISIRVENPDFELPFGRHGLKDEDVLNNLSNYLRLHILPQYFSKLIHHYEGGTLDRYGILPSHVEEIACGLIAYDPDDDQDWNRMRIFRVLNDTRHSYADIQSSVRLKGRLYIEGKEDEGIDYSTFDLPVLAKKQPEGGMDILEYRFKKRIVNLGLNDVVIEVPEGSGKELGPKEKSFEQCLGFHPEVLEKRWQQERKEDEGSGGTGKISGGADGLSLEDIERMACVCDESKEAMGDLSQLQWRVNYLVQRDGKTPAVNHRFLFYSDTIVLNLNHREVVNLLMLSDKVQGLASHWAMAICLADNNVILSHLTSEARQDLILLDGMAKCGMTSLPVKVDDHIEDEDERQRLLDFLRESGDNGFSLN